MESQEKPEGAREALIHSLGTPDPESPPLAEGVDEDVIPQIHGDTADGAGGTRG